MGTVRIFNHYYHSSFVLLALVEALIFSLAFYGSAVLQASYGQPGALLPETWQGGAFGIALIGLMAAMGLYQPQLREGTFGILLRVCGAFALAAALGFGAIRLVAGDASWQPALPQALALSFIGALLVRLVFLHTTDSNALRSHVLVLGSGKTAARMMESMRRRHDRRGFRFVGFVQIADEQSQVDPDSVVRNIGSICDYARRMDVQKIVVAVDDRRNGLPIDSLLECRLHGIEVVHVTDFFEQQTSKIMLDFLTPGWMVFGDGFRKGSAKALAKRSSDIAAALILLVVAWPIMLLTALAIKLEDGLRAPVLYRQLRVGMRGNAFGVLKFRSMRTDAESNGAQWASKNDDRVTRVGRIIRRTRIDELPQIFNVLAGQMAFVGPRPERPEFVRDLATAIPHFSTRHYVKPGITGWAQLNYPYGASVDDAKQKLQYDLYYVKNQSLFLDLLILFSTIEIILFGRGVR